MFLNDEGKRSKVFKRKNVTRDRNRTYISVVFFVFFSSLKVAEDL